MTEDEIKARNEEWCAKLDAVSCRNMEYGKVCSFYSEDDPEVRAGGSGGD